MYKCYPVDYINVTTGFSSSHQAIDLGWWGDTSDRPIYSVDNGKVLEIRNDYNKTDTSGSSYGNYVLIENTDGTRSTYAHLKYQSVLVKVGDIVKQHQQIGTMGNTGYSKGPHLHYEHRINGVKVNPFDNLYRFCFQELYTEKPNAKYVKSKPAYKVGEMVVVNGYGHKTNEKDSGDTGYFTDYVNEIVEIKNGEYPFHVRGVEWAREKYLLPFGGKYKIGDEVLLDGYYHKESKSGSETIGEVHNYLGKIDKIENNEYCYHIEDMGWVREKYLTPYSGKDYEQLYKQELLKNKDLQKQVENLQAKIEKAIEDLK